jgi:hypothetical protein
MLEPLLLTAALIASTIFGWDEGGRTLAAGRVNVAIGAGDGGSGALVGWIKNSDDFAAQRITAAGLPAPGWPAGGRIVAGSGFFEGPAGAAAGAVGDCFFLWSRSVVGGDDLYLSHFDAAGTLDPLWPSDGLGVAVGPMQIRSFLMVPDGTGGVLVTWEEEVYFSPANSTRFARLLRILASGAVATGWPSQGVLVASSNPGPVIQGIVPDGSGGCTVTWMQYDQGVGNFARAQRILADGTTAPGWPATGLRVCSVNSLQTLASEGCAIADGVGGVYIAWDDGREDPANNPLGSYGDIYMTRLNADGTRPPGWPDTGLPIHVAPGAQWDARMCTDGAGGALVAWTDRSTGKARMSRVTPSGALAPGWQPGGNLVCDAPGTAENPRLAADGAGGAYAGWSNYISNDHAIAQHMRGDGTFAPGWTLAGAPLVDLAGYHSEQNVSIFPSTPGTAIMTWADCRVTQSQCSIRAQKLVTDGLVPTQLALRSAEVDPGRVRLAWWGVGAAGAAYAVERSRDGEQWRALGAADAEGDERLTYEDRDVHAGERLAYRLVDGSGRVVVGAAWVEVPQALEFALSGAAPNPVRVGALSVRFALAEQAPGTLELLDVAGRRVAWRELASLAPGTHTLPFPESASLAPGMHWLRLRQGTREASARVVLTR